MILINPKRFLDGDTLVTHAQYSVFRHAVEAAGQVNSWVEKVTSGLIKEFLPPRSVDRTTALVLCNALYLLQRILGSKFDAFETKDGEFHLFDGSSVQTPFMASTKDQYISSYRRRKSP